jgi:gluconokinase
MLQVIVVMGVSGCGKTAVGRLLAERLGWEFLDADDFHPPENVARMRRGEPLTDAERAPWLDRLRQKLDAASVSRPEGEAPHPAVGRCAREGIVLACSVLARRYRQRLGLPDERMKLVHLDGPAAVILARLKERTGHFMPATLFETLAGVAFWGLVLAWIMSLRNWRRAPRKKGEPLFKR